MRDLIDGARVLAQRIHEAEAQCARDSVDRVLVGALPAAAIAQRPLRVIRQGWRICAIVGYIGDEGGDSV